MPFIWQVTYSIVFLPLGFMLVAFLIQIPLKDKAELFQNHHVFYKTTGLLLSSIQKFPFIKVIYWEVLISSYLLRVTRKKFMPDFLEKMTFGANWPESILSFTLIWLFLVDTDSLQFLKVDDSYQSLIP